MVIDRAIVLRVWEFSETSQTASLLCREHGLVRGLAKGAHREKSNFGGGLEPLTLGDIVYTSKPALELAALTEWNLREIFWGARRALAAHRAGLHMADLAFHAILDHDPHPALFDALASSLRALSNPARVDDALLFFQWRLLREIGYRPRLDVDPADSAKTHLFRPAAGGFAPDTQTESEAWRVRSETVRVLVNLSRDETLDGPTRPPEVVRRAARLLSEYLRYVLARDVPTRELIFGRPQGATA